MLHFFCVSLPIGQGLLLQSLSATAVCQQPRTLQHARVPNYHVANAPRTSFIPGSISFQRLATSRATSGNFKSGSSSTTMGRMYWLNSKNADLPRFGLFGSRARRRRRSLGMVKLGTDTPTSTTPGQRSAHPQTAREQDEKHTRAPQQAGVGRRTNNLNW